MRKWLLLGLLLQISTKPTCGQLITGSSFFVSANCKITIDGLHLRPSANTTALSNRTISLTMKPIKGSLTASINQVYHFNEPIQFSGTLGIHYNPAELNGNAESDLQIAYFNPDEKYVTTSGGYLDLDEDFISKDFTNKSLLRITAVNANSVLPVTLISFQARWAEAQVALTWTTSSEENSDYFEIQRSADGRSWEALGKVDADGDRRGEKTYAFHDPNPQCGQNLYRLKMADRDGTYTFSRIVAVKQGAEAAFKVYPNPVQDKLYIEARDWASVSSVQMVSKQGSPVALELITDTEKANVRAFDCANIPAGIYIVTILRTSGTKESEQVVKLP